jgi:hypothetical protein
MRKANIIIDIRPELRQYHEVKGYYILHDNWVTEHNDILCDKEGNEYLIMEFKEIELAEAINTNIPLQIPCPRLAWMKHSAVKLDADLDIKHLEPFKIELIKVIKEIRGSKFFN